MERIKNIMYKNVSGTKKCDLNCLMVIKLEIKNIKSNLSWIKKSSRILIK